MTPTTGISDDTDLQTRMETEHSARVVRERALLDEAREDVRGGRMVADEEVDAWLDRFVRGEALPMPDGTSASHGK